jgi:predicted tellurium resistance membrane protein TerC
VVGQAGKIMGWTELLVAITSLTTLEVVLGIDNLVLLALITQGLPMQERGRARRIGLLAALGTRLLLLGLVTLLMQLNQPLFHLPGRLIGAAEDVGFSGKQIILMIGGLFLVYKGVHEIHEKLEGPEGEDEELGGRRKASASFGWVIAQIALIDILFSLDSVITAVGMVQSFPAIVVAMLITVGVLLFFSEPVSKAVERHPTLQMLALSFVILIGSVLIMEGFGKHVEKGYIYFAMGFSVVVESLNLISKSRKGKPVELRPPHLPGVVADGPEASEQREIEERPRVEI